MAARNQSEAVPNFRPSNQGGEGAVEADTPVSYRPPLDTPTVKRRHNFSPNQLFHNRSGFPSGGKCAPPLNWQASSMQCPARESTGG